MWHGTVDKPGIDFVAITAAYNREPYLAPMLVTITKDDLAVDDTSVGFGPSRASITAPATWATPHDGGTFSPFFFPSLHDYPDISPYFARFAQMARGQ